MYEQCVERAVGSGMCMVHATVGVDRRQSRRLAIWRWRWQKKEVEAAQAIGSVDGGQCRWWTA